MQIIFSLAHGCRNDVAVFNKVDENDVSIFRFKNHVFPDRVFTLMLSYRKQFMHILKIFQML